MTTDALVANPTVYLDDETASAFAPIDATLEHWEQTIKAQCLTDVDAVETKALKMRPEDGAMTRDGVHFAGYTRRALQHLTALFRVEERNLAGCLTYFRTPARSVAFADMIEQEQPRQVVLRLARVNGQPVIRAVVSDRHSLSSGDDMALIGAIREFEGLAQDATMSYVRGWDYTRAHLITGESVNCGSGVSIRTRCVFQNSETKSCSFGAAAGAYVTLTGSNVTLPWVKQGSSTRHLGSRVTVAMLGDVERAMTDMHNVADMFRRAGEKNIDVVMLTTWAAQELGLDNDASAALALTVASIPEPVGSSSLARVVLGVSAFSLMVHGEQRERAEQVAGQLLTTA